MNLKGEITAVWLRSVELKETGQVVGVQVLVERDGRWWLVGEGDTDGPIGIVWESGNPLQPDPLAK